MERLVSTTEAAEILGLSLQGIHYRIKKNQLKSVKQDGKVFVYVEENIKNNETKKEKTTSTNSNFDSFQAVIEVKNEQIELLKKSLKWMKKQYISEIFRLEKNQKRIIEVFNSEIQLLQSAFNEMRSIYKPQIEDKKVLKEEKTGFLALKDFFIIMKRANKTELEIKNIIFEAIKNGDSRFIYNKSEKKLLILDADFNDLV